MRRPQDERIPAPKRKAEVLDSRKNRMPMVKDSKQVIKWLKLIVISPLLSFFCLKMSDLDILITQVML